MKEETKNLIMIVLLGGFALASFWVWRRKQSKANNGIGVTAGDIYLEGGTPTGDKMTIPDPDNGNSDTGNSLPPFFSFIESQAIG